MQQIQLCKVIDQFGAFVVWHLFGPFNTFDTPLVSLNVPVLNVQFELTHKMCGRYRMYANFLLVHLVDDPLACASSSSSSSSQRPRVIEEALEVRRDPTPIDGGFEGENRPFSSFFSAAFDRRLPDG